MAIADGIEIVGYVFGFWLFIFSKKYRTDWVYAFSRGDTAFKVFAVLEAISAIFCGVLAPVFLILLLLYLALGLGTVT